VTDPNHVVAKNFFLSPLLLTTWMLKSFHHLLSQFTWACKRLDSSLLLCSANQILHIPLATYYLLPAQYMTAAMFAEMVNFQIWRRSSSKANAVHPQSVLPLKWQTRNHTHAKQQLNYNFVYFNLHVFRQKTGRRDFELHGSMHSPNLVCS
jgi:hypothetical protein